MANSPSFIPDVVLCGEALIDVIETEDHLTRDVPGGSPLNTAIALSRQGIKTSLVSRISYDPFGELLRTVLGESRVDLSRAISCSEPTTLAIATPNGSGSMNYTFEIDGHSDGTWNESDTMWASEGAKFLVVSGGLAMTVPSMTRAIDQLLKQDHENQVVVFDPNVRPALIKDPAQVAAKMDEWCGLATIVKASSDDVAWRWPEKPFQDVAEEWIANGCALAIVTDGANGVYVCHPHHSTWRKAPKIEIADSIGAGDTFTAGLVEWLLKSGKTTPEAIEELTAEEIVSAVDSGIDLASDTCTRFGADPPWKSERNEYRTQETLELTPNAFDRDFAQ